MNYRMIARLLAIILLIVAVLMVPALVISLAMGEPETAWGFGITLALMLILSILLRLLKPQRQTMFARLGFVVVSLAWILVSMLGALPFYISRSIPSYIDCLFETVSGFTTTGASILTDVESLPKGLIYWRSFTHWIGGMGVLVFLLAISPLASGDSLFIMRAESPGPQVSKLVPRTRQSARILYEIYIAMTVVQIILLLAGGMSAFDAVTIAFGTAGTGGFAIRNDSMMSYSPYIQWVVTIFMVLFGVNFGLYYLMLQRSYRKIVKNEELRFYIGILVASTAVITLFIAKSYDGVQNSIRHAAFQVASIMTTTGYATTDFDRWPEVCRALLIILMIVGASAGSTGGGIKCSRVLILFKTMKQEVKKILHPNTVSNIRVDGELIMPETVRQTFVFLGLYASIALFSVLLISLDGFSLETNMSAVMACINNIGPGLSMVGPMGNYSQFSNASKIVLTLNMLLGRLEIFPLVIMVFPSIWKRAR
jgi:trk system potassium uptake protein TrkH